MSQNQAQELLTLFFDDSFDALDEWERVCLKLRPGDPISAMEPIFRCAHNLKGGAGLVGMQTLYEKLHRFEDFLVKVRDLGLSFSPETVHQLLQLEKFLRGWLEQARTNLEYVPDSAEIERELEALTSVNAPQATVVPIAAPMPRAREPITPAAAKAQLRVGDETVKTEETLRVMASRLDHLIQLVGEISLHQAILERSSREGTLGSQTVRNVIDIKSKLTQDLQDAALSLRMIPIEGLFQRIERVVRETASQLRKVVSVLRRGDEVTLDKLVVDRMLDPLIHIARNAMDHGIEPVEERVTKGKRPNGLVRLTAEYATGGVTLIFEDDGRGIDPERIYNHAVERGLVPAGTEMTDLAKQQLIFLPGLSTADKVSEISGRGIGMDVVADTISKMGGRVDLQSTLGEGTRFTMTLPTNLSILDALVVRVDGCQYAIPNQELAEVINFNQMNVQSVNAGRDQVFQLRGRVVPVEAMSSFLKHNQVVNVGGGVPDPESGRPGVVVQFREEFLAFSVDEVIGQQQIFVRPVIDSLSPVTFFGGSTILSDGEPSLILNLTEMARQYFDSH